jgi:RNA polymerase subunit RPABC4/transcription elongation factor Spt4
MALLTCHECGNSISSTANRCPHCGGVTKRAQRNTVAILVIMAVLALAYLLQ